MNRGALRVLALSTYPELAAATRHRILQYVPLLADEGIEVHFRPFLSNETFAGLYDRRRVARTAAGIGAGILRRAGEVLRLGRYDAAFIQREAALVGPPLFEWLARRRLPLVLDLDDSTYLDRKSDVFGSLALLVKGRGKTDRLIRWSRHVVCGSPAIAAHVEKLGRSATILPTLVDVNRFTPRERRGGDHTLTLGWIGTHSTLPYFRTIIPALQRLAREHRFHVRLVGAGQPVQIDGVDVESLLWSLERELADLQSFDVAVYPLQAEEWAQGKSGFKAIQYLSCGIPYVASPIGVVADVGIPGVTHLEARTEDEWVNALGRLLADAAARAEMGRQGRAYAVEHYSVRRAAAILARILRDTAQKNSHP